MQADDSFCFFKGSMKDVILSARLGFCTHVRKYVAERGALLYCIVVVQHHPELTEQVDRAGLRFRSMNVKRN